MNKGKNSSKNENPNAGEVHAAVVLAFRPGRMFLLLKEFVVVGFLRAGSAIRVHAHDLVDVRDFVVRLKLCVLR